MTDLYKFIPLFNKKLGYLLMPNWAIIFIMIVGVTLNSLLDLYNIPTKILHSFELGIDANFFNDYRIILFTLSFIFLIYIISSFINVLRKYYFLFFSNSSNNQHNYVSQGGNNYLDDSWYVDNSFAGLLFTNKIYKSVTIEFDYRPESISSNGINELGILFRAQSLDDYYMAQITFDYKNYKLRIRPHSKISGLWSSYTLMSVTTPVLLIDLPIKLKFVINNNEVEIYINKVLIAKYQLESYFQHGIVSVGDELRSPISHPFSRAVNSVYFYNKFGFIGFRTNDGGTITNLEIEGKDSFFQKMAPWK